MRPTDPSDPAATNRRRDVNEVSMKIPLSGLWGAALLQVSFPCLLPFLNAWRLALIPFGEPLLEMPDYSS
jgi:hypothetical protein